MILAESIRKEISDLGSSMDSMREAYKKSMEKYMENRYSSSANTHMEYCKFVQGELSTANHMLGVLTKLLEQAKTRSWSC